MSRSYRKPVIKDGAHWRKKLHARAYRSRCKQISRVYCKEWNQWIDCDMDDIYIWVNSITGKEVAWYEVIDDTTPIHLSVNPLIGEGKSDPVYPSPHEITNQYDICDWKMIYDGYEWTWNDDHVLIYTKTEEGLNRMKIACRK